MVNDATFITRLRSEGTGATLAVKDLIDVVGVPTTAGSLAVAEQAVPAERDAACLAGARESGARIVGKANLHELAFGAAGVNEHFGTPRNPLDSTRIPGGSSSGSAVAVAVGEAELALGSDTGGSIRVPAAFCGVTGLKTTWGRVPLDGVWPLAPSLDTVGPMARDVSGVVAAMGLLEPGFSAAPASASRIGRIRPADVAVDPLIEAAIDAALAALGIEIREISVPTWSDAYRLGVDLLVTEAAVANGRAARGPRAGGQAVAGGCRTPRLGSACGRGAPEGGAGRPGTSLDDLAPAIAEVRLLALPLRRLLPAAPRGGPLRAQLPHTLPDDAGQSGRPTGTLPPRPDGRPLPGRRAAWSALQRARNCWYATGPSSLRGRSARLRPRYRHGAKTRGHLSCSNGQRTRGGGRPRPPRVLLGKHLERLGCEGRRFSATPGGPRSAPRSPSPSGGS